MATTSFLYHALGLIRYRLIRTEFRGGAIYYHVVRKSDERFCAHCRASRKYLTMAGGFKRQFRALPVGRRPQFVVLHGHEQRCRRCGRVLREPIDFALGKRRRLKSFDRYVIDLCQMAPIKQVATLLGVSWDMVKDIFKEYLGRQLKKRKLKNVRYIAVDEFSIKKGHRYMTLVLDLESGQIIHAREGRDAAVLIPFLKKLRRRGVRLQAVAMDMWPAYIRAVGEVFPEVDIVHDPYHVVAMANRAIDQIRREMYQSLKGDKRQVIKGTRFLLLSGWENLDLSGRKRILELMKLNEPLYAAYVLKEELRSFWKQPDLDSGQKLLDGWIETVKEVGLWPLIDLARTLEKHRRGLLAWFRHRISTGPLEGLNNKIKVLKRQAYGFRDLQYFKLRLYFLHESNLAFAG